MQGFAKEICETYRTDLTEFTIYIENWNDKPILLKKIIEKLEDWVDSHQIMIGGI